MIIYSLEVYILLFYVFLQKNKHLENFCEVKQITCIKGPVGPICNHQFPGKLSKHKAWVTAILGHVQSKHTPRFYNTFATSKDRTWER